MNKSHEYSPRSPRSPRHEVKSKTAAEIKHDIFKFQNEMDNEAIAGDVITVVNIIGSPERALYHKKKESNLWSKLTGLSASKRLRFSAQTVAQPRD
jgi:FPC/CPF motif-containing protein YcgG